MSFFGISSLLNFILQFSISLLFLVKIKSKTISGNLGYACFAASLWGLGGFMSTLADTKESALLWIRFAHIGTILTPVMYFDFIYNLSKKEARNKFLLISAYILSFIFLSLNFIYDKFYKVDYYFNSLYFFKANPRDNFIYIIFYLLFYQFLLFYAIYLLLSNLKVVEKEKRNQIKYLILGSLVGWSGPEGMYLFVIFNLPIYPFSNILISIMSLILAYAIFKHQLLDINLVIKKSIIYSILAAFITGIYFLLVFSMGNFFQGLFGYKSIALNLLAVFAISFIFTPLKNLIQSFIDRSFFKGTLTSLAEEKRLLEDELRRSDRLKAVATLAAGMAHEIKNPLTGIKTFTEYLDKNKDNPEFIDKFKKIVGSEVDKINNIVHQLLDFAKPSPLTLIECDIQQILDETLSLLSSDFLKHNIILEKEFKVENAKINADFNQLKQAFLNIFLNSIRAMPNGGSLKIGTSLYLDKVQVIIRDTGIGIAEKDLPHIFDPFYTTTDEGTGLGLSITHGIIKEHNGRVDVESNVGVGTKFAINFPLLSI